MSSTLLNNNVLIPLTETQSHYNTRFKYFGDTTKIVCFSKAIFNPHRFELREKTYVNYVQTERAEQTELADETEQTEIAEKTEQIECAEQTERAETRTDSVKRARDKCYEIAYANKFKYFITLTLDKNKCSRDDLPTIYKALKAWLSNNVQRRGLSYILCPEYHKDGNAVHFHGLCSGELPLIDSGTVSVTGEKKPMKKAKAARLGLSGKTIYNLENWLYGFSTAIILDDNIEGISKYILKYITKEQGMIFGRNYFSGGKLERSVPTEYVNYPYCNFDGEEKVVLKGVLAVKYKTL